MTAAIQVVIVIVGGSVALLADIIHNFSDALTAIPLGIAFLLGRRPPTKRYTYGYGRAEDLAGVFIVAMIALSAAVAGFEAVRRLLDPLEIRNVGWALAAGVVGFLGNELVAVYRIQIGNKIGSAALVAEALLNQRSSRPFLRSAARNRQADRSPGARRGGHPRSKPGDQA